MRGERLSLVLETGLVISHVAGDAHINTRLLREVELEGQVVEYDLVHLQVRLHEVNAGQVAHYVGQLARSVRRRQPLQFTGQST